MKNKRTLLIAFGLIFLMGFGQAMPRQVWAVNLDELENQKEQTQQQREDAQQELDDAQKKADELKGQADDLEGEYNALNSRLQAVAGDINDTENAIVNTTQEIEDLYRQLEDAKQKSSSQYESMKKRIQYIYENGNDSFLVTLLSSGSIAEFVRRSEYIFSIVSYDQKMLEEYADLQNTITAKTQELSEKQTQLSAYQGTLAEKHRQMDELVMGAGKNLSAKKQEVNAAQMTADEFSAEIDRLEQKEKDIDRQIADEQLRLAEEIAKEQEKEEQENGKHEDTGGALEGYTQADLTLMAAIIQAESDNQPYEGKLAVGSVVMNRIKSSKFPNTVSGVIYQKNQFAPVTDGHLALILERGPNQTCYKAAKQVLEGYRNVDYLFFWAKWLADERNIYDRTYGVVIGDHYFYNYK